VVTWNIALDPTGGPHLGGCDTCTRWSRWTRAPDSVSTNAEYYTIGHLAQFVRPGAVRIASTSFGTTGWNGQIMDVAFRNPDGSTALVVHNENDDPRTFAVAVGGGRSTTPCRAARWRRSPGRRTACWTTGTTWCRCAGRRPPRRRR
jgi:glucosylceramidase